MKPHEQLAFWLNAYNLLTLHARIKHISVYTSAKDKSDLFRDLRCGGSRAR